jgi:hypothetical protein
MIVRLLQVYDVTWTAYPPEVNTREKALACARVWYQAEMAERLLRAPVQGRPLTWS